MQSATNCFHRNFFISLYSRYHFCIISQSLLYQEFSSSLQYEKGKKHKTIGQPQITGVTKNLAQTKKKDNQIKPNTAKLRRTTQESPSFYKRSFRRQDRINNFFCYPNTKPLGNHKKKEWSIFKKKTKQIKLDTVAVKDHDEKIKGPTNLRKTTQRISNFLPTVISPPKTD